MTDIEEVQFTYFSNKSYTEMMEIISIPPAGFRFIDNSFSGLITSLRHESEKKGTQYYQHPTGEQRSIKNRMEFAMKVLCPTCKENVERPCLSVKHNPTAAGYEAQLIKYPHDARFKEALAQQKEAELNFP